MTTRHVLTAGTLLGVLSLVVPLPSDAEHVKIEVPAQPSPTVVLVPPAAPVAVTAPAPTLAPQTLQANEIKANLVRANTIYANKIEAHAVQGAVHQGNNVKLGDTRGDIKAPEVAASVIYADEIKANAVVADHIYVRKFERP